MRMADILERILLRPTIERFMFGMTAEEAVAKRLALIDERTGQVLKRMVDALEEDDESPDNDEQ